MIHLGEQYFPSCCCLPVTFKNISQNFALKFLQSMYQIWDVRGVEKNSSPWRELKFCHPSHRQSHYSLSFRLKITYICLAILKVAVRTACCNIKLLCIVPHSRFIINLLSVKKKPWFRCTEHSKLLFWFHTRLVRRIRYEEFTQWESIIFRGMRPRCLVNVYRRFYLPTDAQERCFNPSAWGHLKPSSYCDVGRFFYKVFKFWAKLCRSLFRIM